MKVSIDWLKEFIDLPAGKAGLKIPLEEVTALIPLRTIGTKEITKDFIELDMKGYNRADLLSLRGVAYEIAAITGSLDSPVKFTEPDETKYLWVEETFPKLEVTVADEQLTPVYCLAKIEGLRVGPSDQAWVKKLTDCGLRSINNIADITNLVMLEYGQPLHAFNAESVRNEKVIVRCAKKGEIITTLDGKVRDLETSDLLITDPQNALGIAGVMGGKDSEVSDSTTTILLEAAIFDPSSIRKAATRLKLQSEASKRFYHGLTRKRLLQALNAAIKMYEQLGGRLTGITLTGNFKDQTKSVQLTQEKINSLIGVDIPSNQVENSLTKLGCKLNLRSHLLSGKAIWDVAIPYWRLDINIEEDLIEEIARMYGYEKIPAQELVGEIPPKIDQSLFALIYRLKTALVDLGLTEVQTYSFYSTDVLNNFEFAKDELVRVANPISSETEYLRSQLWPNLIKVVVENLKYGYKDLTVFELGKTYHPKENSIPEEKYCLGLTLINGTDNPIQELSQILNQLKTKISHIGGVINEQKLFHPTRCANLAFNGQSVGKVVEIHPRILDKFGIAKRVAVAEIAIDYLE